MAMNAIEVAHQKLLPLKYQWMPSETLEQQVHNKQKEVLYPQRE